MRLYRPFGIALVVLAAACEHNEVTELISRDGATTIPVIDLNTAAAGGFLSGTRVTNRFLSSGPFDTSITNAFGRTTANPPYFRLDVNGYYGTATSLMYFPNAPGIAAWTPPTAYLPTVAPAANAGTGGFAPNAVAYIVQPGHPGNGAGNTVWEFWFEVHGLAADTRYIMGLARYAVEQRGALDIAEMLLTGAVTQPDTLVFPTGDFNEAGKKANGVYTTNCASVNILQPVAGANPHLIAGGTSDATGYAGFDQTACANAASAWGNLGTAKSAVAANSNTAPANVQYNFLVIWEAEADSTPNYDKPALRVQIAPLLTTTGQVVNNSYAPFPTAALTGAQLALLPGATASPDTIGVTANGLVPLAAGNAYQVWLTTAAGTAAKVSGRVIRLNAGAVVDTVAGDVSEFTIGAGMDGARMEFDFLPFRAEPYNAAVVAVGAVGAGTLPASQPLWTSMVTQKVPGGAVPSLSSSLSFGSFDGGSGPRLFGAAGTATGGIFGTELREDIKRIPRPPVGYQYEGWLVSSTDATAPLSLGPILSPYPDLQPLTDADISTDPPLSGVEVTQAAVRYVATAAAFYCDWDRVQVRLGPKNGAGSLPPTILLSGTNPRAGC
ncbi:MAG TPA: hypothetical protein VD707_05945 [Gemmatimonadales bacterium]|jgi:hypothetical protein|nr:hypothetical protein [Gemmatimonadales bacterium]